MSELRRYGKQLRGKGKIRKAKAVEVRDLQQYGAIEMDGLLLCKKKDSAPIYSHRSRRSIFFIKMRGVLPHHHGVSVTDAMFLWGINDRWNLTEEEYVKLYAES